jgi:hypothetical protein
MILTLAIAPASVFAQASAPTTRPAAPLPADQMLKDMLTPADRPAGKDLREPDRAPATDATSGKHAVAPGAPQVNVLREGSFIVDRTGRLTRSADGQRMEFTFDSDGRAMRDPPLIILPNLKLMAMEDAVSTSSRDLHFRVTGVVTEYRGRNYVLLEKVVVVPDVTQQF